MVIFAIAQLSCSYGYNAFTYWTTTSGEYKNQIKDVHKLRERTLYEWDKLDSTKSLESGERELELIWMQQENSLNANISKC